MTVAFNENGGREISPGPRGYSMVGIEVSPDGTVAYPLTDQPGKLNGFPLPVGPRGPRGYEGLPGEARIRIDQTVGYRVMMWDTATAGENRLFGDTGVWDIGGGVLVHRHNNTVTTTATDPTTLPAGFRPAVGGAGAGKTFTTVQEWPATVTGTVVTPPDTGRGLEDFEAAAAQGFPGSAQEWIDMVYGVLPTNGVPGQWLQWGPIGPMWGNLPNSGPDPWQGVTLTKDWATLYGAPQVRRNQGTVEGIGHIKYTGGPVTAGPWGSTAVRVGVMPPALAPEESWDCPIVTYDGSQVGAPPVHARLWVNKQGVISVMGFDEGVELRVNAFQVNLTLIRYAIRNSSPTP